MERFRGRITTLSCLWAYLCTWPSRPKSYTWGRRKWPVGSFHKKSVRPMRSRNQLRARQATRAMIDVRVRKTKCREQACCQQNANGDKPYSDVLEGRMGKTLWMTCIVFVFRTFSISYVGSHRNPAGLLDTIDRRQHSFPKFLRRVLIYSKTVGIQLGYDGFAKSD